MALKHKYQIWVEKYSAPEHANFQNIIWDSSYEIKEILSDPEIMYFLYFHNSHV